MKIHGTAKGGALDKKDFGVAFGGASTSIPLVKDSQAFANTGDSTSTTLTVQLTIAENDNRILVVSAGSYAPSYTIDSITWGTTDLTPIIDVFSNSPHGPECELWYLINPDADTKNVTVTYSGAVGRRGVGAISFYNAHQDNPIGIKNKENSDTGTGGTINGTITPTSDTSAIVDGMFWLTGQAPSLALTAGFATLISNGVADRAHGMQYDLTPTKDSANAMEYTSAEAAGWAWVGAEILPA